MILLSRVILDVIIFILKIGGSSIGIAGDGVEVGIRAKNDEFEGVELSLGKPLLDTS